MEDIFSITTLEQLRAISDPLRQRLLHHFAAQSATTKQVAVQLGERPSKLYHHVEALEAAGLLHLVETRPNRGTLEKYYRAVARQFTVDHTLLSGEQEALNELQKVTIQILQDSLNEAYRRFHDEGAEALKTMVLAHIPPRLNKAQAQYLAERLQSLLAELQDQPVEDSATPYSLTITLFPLREDE